MTYIEKTLPNGLRVILYPMQGTETVTAMTLVETGSKYETKKQNGLSHFLEHMCFKGTTKRPSSFLISKELDEIGAQYNAFTSYEYTGYYAKAAINHFEKIFDVVSDIYLHPLFNQAEIDKERGVIIEEINMYEDDPKRQIFEVFMKGLYGDQPVGLPIAGSKENVTHFKTKDFFSYHRSQYIPEKTLVVIAGNFDQKKALLLIKKTFGSKENNTTKNKLKVKDTQTQPTIVIQKKDTDQVHFVMGFRTCDVHHEDSIVLDVIAGILSGGFSSRLLMKLREELGVAYYVSSFSDQYTDHGYFAIRAGIAKDKVELVLSEIYQLLSELKTNSVSDTELKKVQEYLIGGMKLDLETSDSFANFFGGQAIMRRSIETTKDIETKIMQVTPQMITKVLHKYIIFDRVTLALIGKNISLQKIKKTTPV